ncbi:DNA-binding transcriptional response regulator, NtrC family, contains REC, AAA-type ATPase, and a Fis-type DNA-binding domains [Pseudomonas asplenii]|uniref:DNA-binding transcriptional response regulator, NtrC family, contains REC, AAA-type ATPase, and a Fis-type DNA-binding domains n=1 Tax=Pseudomonas asplenii TaxID=53407 RepID=A0A1H6P150_9PSED|nr:sigma 54-interacting transcriptional regulator [Pseudomonas fuscovaginae]SEI17560.1 DNA-binding transcriptional response regulator, NtrC family, contains REC, AAA-type ATPase, and a Fis-type DNA-binding domains [Pseudomonas fuscovaginae]
MSSPTRKRPQVLLSWISMNHGGAPIVTALLPASWPRSSWPLSQRFNSVYLCWRNAPDDDSGKRALERTRHDIEKVFPKGLKIKDIPWDTLASPTNHDAIYDFALKALWQVRRDHPEAMITLHLSPGTPASHAVWLALGSTGAVEGPLQLIQTRKEDQAQKYESLVQVTTFKLDTWLQRYRLAQPEYTGSDDTGHNIEPMQAQSPALCETIKQLKRWAPLRVPVLLLGERGTGKTTLANLLRAQSQFQKDGVKEWPSVVCGQFRVNPQLAQANLFGHEKGAFTGAEKLHKGLLEQADGDSLFFDEIADLDRDTQRMLMAALEGRGFQRIGGTQTQHSNFRLICATNCCLSRLQDELLDPDFFDRIGTFILRVPPLRECVEDIPHFWTKTLENAVKSAGISIEGWRHYSDHPTLLRQLQKHPLPGNFRDLQRAAYHLLAALAAGCEQDEVLSQAISALPVQRASSEDDIDLAPLTAQLPIDVRARLATQEMAWFRAALQRSRNSKTEAAELLKLPRKTFVNKLKALSDAESGK